MSFTSLNLDENIYKALTACGYTTPTPIQAKSIPVIMEGKDLVACAQTGTGKTAAFVLPALHRLSIEKPTKKTKILILTPTRELAAQITKAAAMYGKFLRFNIVSLVGGMSYHTQIRDLQRGADVIVATPGRLLDHINSKRVNLSNVEMLVLDEADRMLDMGFIDDVGMIAEMTPEDRQTLLFSATVDKQLTSVIRKLQKDPVWIDLSGEKLSAPKIKQELYRANSQQHKMRLLKHFLANENVFKAIIFSATKINADKLANQLCNEGYAAAALHGDLRQNVRNRTVEELRRGKIQFLVATDVAARGIDIADVTHVINYDLPRFCEDYVHRIGRTGRAGKEGIAISFVAPTDMRHVKNIERFTGQRLQIINHVEGMAPAPEHEKPLSDEYRPFKKRSIEREDSEHRSSRYSRDAAPKRSFGGGRERFGRDDRRPSRDDAAPKRFSRDDHRPARDDSAPRKSFGGDRERFGSDYRRPARDDAAPKRSFGGGRERFGSDDRRPARDDAAPKRYNRDDNRPARDDSAPKRFSRDDNRPSRDGAAPKRFNRDDRKPSRDGAAPKRSFGGGRDRSGSDDRRPARDTAPARPKKQYGVSEGRIQSDSVKEIRPTRSGFKKRSIGGADNAKKRSKE